MLENLLIKVRKLNNHLDIKLHTTLYLILSILIALTGRELEANWHYDWKLFLKELHYLDVIVTLIFLKLVRYLHTIVPLIFPQLVRYLNIIVALIFLICCFQSWLKVVNYKSNLDNRLKFQLMFIHLFTCLMLNLLIQSNLATINQRTGSCGIKQLWTRYATAVAKIDAKTEPFKKSNFHYKHHCQQDQNHCRSVVPPFP